MARSENVVGNVISLQGEAFIRMDDGTQISLKVGDEVQEGDVIVTSPGGHVELEFQAGSFYAVRENEVLTLDASVFGDEVPEPRNAALLARAGDGSDIRSAIALGESLDELLEETEAGLEGGGGSAGHSFVRLERLLESVTPLSFDFGATSRSALPEFPFDSTTGLAAVDESGVDSGTSLVMPPPTIASVTSDSQTEGTDLVHTVTLSNASAVETSFAFTLAGNSAAANDFGTPLFSNGVSLVGGNVLVPAGVTSFTVTIATTGDSVDENDETLDLTVGGVAAVGTIVDNDGAPSLSVNDISINEAAGTATFTVTLSAASGQTVTVGYNTNNGTATAGSDYTSITGTLTFAPGTTTQTVTVNVGNDTLTEVTETFNLNLVSPTNATLADSQGVASIIDNDAPPTAGGAYVAGTEDTPLVFSWSNFNVADVDTAASGLSVRITSLPADGALQYSTNGTTWLSVTANQVISKATIDAGRLRFVPDANEAGADIFGGTATGNLQSDYAGFNYQAFDGVQSSATAIVRIDIAPVVDAPAVAAGNASGTEGQWISLALSAVLTDLDGSEALSARVLSGIPVGAIITDGSQIFTATAGNTSLNLSGWNLASMQFQSSATGVSQTYSMTLSATSIESSIAASGASAVSFNVTVADTAPLASADTDSVGVGATSVGNVVTGAGVAVGGADTLAYDAAQISNVSFSGTPVSSSYSGGVWTIETANGILSIGQAGAYSYVSKYANKSVASTTTATGWDNANIDYYGFDREDGTGDSNPFIGATASSGLSTAKLTSAAGSLIDFDNNSGSSDDGMGVERGNGSGRVQSGEYIVLDMNMSTSAIALTLNGISNGDNATWYAYDTNGVYLNTGTVTSTSNSDFTANISVPGARYLVLAYGNDDFRIAGLVAQPDLSGVTPDVFSYTLTDSDGDTSTTTLTVSTDTLLGTNVDSSTVYESGLASGTQAGITPTVFSGNLLDNDTGVAGNAEITSVGGQTAVGGVITVTNATGTLTVYTVASGAHAVGDYSYTLNAATAHDINNVPIQAQAYDYTVRNPASGQTSTSSLTINIVDDAPIGSDVAHTLQAATAALTYNLVIVLDRSGSMAMDANGNWSSSSSFDPTTVRMEIAKDALAKMIQRFDGLGNVNVQIVDFASDVNESAWFIDNKAGAMDYINNIQAGGGTQYSTALNAVMSGFSPPTADKTLFYFISDGAPTSGYEATTVQTAWENFVAANGDIAFGIGIGGATLDAVKPVAYPNDGTNEPYAIKVTDATDLADTLLATVDGGVVIGNISVLSAGGASGFLLGADGGHLQSVVVDGVEYTYTAGGPESVTITTLKGGEVEVNFITGAYSYQLVLQTTVQGEQEIFPITVVDNDGDTKTINLTINLDYIANLDANADIILTNVTAGTPINISAEALMHNDATSGGAAVTGSQGAVNGVVSGTTTVQFTLTGTPAATIAIASEAPFDSYNQPQNDVRANAVDLTDRSRFGTIVPGGESLSIDQAGSTQIFRGMIDNSGGGTRDYDYVKVKLHNGERIFVDVDNQSQAVNARVEYQDTAGVWQFVTLGNDGSGTVNSWFNAPQDGEFYVRLQTQTSTVDTNYELLLTIDQVSGALSQSGQFDYTVTDNGVASTAAATVYNVSGTTINGSDHDEILVGSGNADILNAGGGNDTLLGNLGADILRGGAGLDRLDGGAGDDTLDGGTGNDMLIGGLGNDSLTGGLGADVFAWQFGDEGTLVTPAIDTITDFDITTSSDKLDLRDLLVGEHESGLDANLEDFLHFETVGADTKVHISSSGGFSGGYAAGQEDQAIILQGVDLLGGFTTDQQVIQDLISRGKLITD